MTSDDFVVYPCGAVKSVFFGGNSCPPDDPYTHNYQLVLTNPDTFHDFIRINNETGELYCQEIYLENEIDFPDRILVDIQDTIQQFVAGTVVIFDIIETYHYKPDIQPNPTIFGYPNFVFLDTPIRMPIGQLTIQDMDRNDQFMFKLMNGINHFDIDVKTGQILPINMEFLPEKSENFQVQVKDLGNNVDVSDVIVVPLKENNIIPLKVQWLPSKGMQRSRMFHCCLKIAFGTFLSLFRAMLTGIFCQLVVL
jgi:hypothetical protein